MKKTYRVRTGRTKRGHKLWEGLSTAVDALPMNGPAPAVRQPSPILGTVLLVAGLEFLVTADRSPTVAQAALGRAVISSGEVERLGMAGQPMPPEMVKCLHAVKLAFPGAAVVSTRNPQERL